MEYKLAVVDGDIGAESEFAAILDQIQAGGELCNPEPDREHVGDILVASWEQSSKQDSLLDWARAVAGVCV